MTAVFLRLNYWYKLRTLKIEYDNLLENILCAFLLFYCSKWYGRFYLVRIASNFSQNHIFGTPISYIHYSMRFQFLLCNLL